MIKYMYIKRSIRIYCLFVTFEYVEFLFVLFIYVDIYVYVYIKMEEKEV